MQAANLFDMAYTINALSCISSSANYQFCGRYSCSTVHCMVHVPYAMLFQPFCQHSHACRRQSNRDSARRTRQRRMEEMNELHQQVAQLTAERSQMAIQNQELKASYQQLASQIPQTNKDYEYALAIGLLNYVRHSSECPCVLRCLGICTEYTCI